MCPVFDWGINLIQWLQTFDHKWLVIFFKVMTFMGDEAFYLILFPVILWVVDFRKGMKIGIIFLVSVYFNQTFKVLLAQPRPFDLVPGINLIEESGFGAPSGHAQNSTVIFGVMMAWTNKKFLKIGLVVLIFLISVSRLYLGVHFPQDLVLGWIVALVILFFYFRAFDNIGDWLEGLLPGTQLFLISLTGIVLCILVPEKTPVYVIGLATGIGWGISLLYKSFEIDFSGGLGKRLARFVIGLVLTIPVYLALKCILPDCETTCYIHILFVTKFLLGLWISWGVTQILNKTKTIRLKPLKK